MPTVDGTVQTFEKRPNNGPYVATVVTPDGRTILLKTFDHGTAREIGEQREAGLISSFTYRDEQGKRINPHTNQPYVDHMVISVGTGSNGASAMPAAEPAIPGLDAAPPPAAAGPAPERSGNFGGGEDPVRAWRIALGIGAHLAVDTLPLLEDRTFESQTQLALAWALWVFTTSPPGSRAPVEQASYGAAAAASAPGAYGDPGSEAPPQSFAGDDIPF